MMRTRATNKWLRVRIILGLVVAVAMLVAVPARAHDETGTFAFEATPDASDPATVDFRARLTYDNDGHPAEGATVVLQAAGNGSNASFAPVTMTEVDPGEYEATTTFPGPGTYDVSISGQNPIATYTTSYTVEAQGTTTTTGPTTTTATSSNDDDGEDDDDSTIPWAVVIVVALVAAAVAGAIVLAMRRRRTG